MKINMNKKGQGTWAFALMLGITVIILSLSMAPLGKEMIDDALGNSTAEFIGLNCDTSTNNFVIGTCTIVDFSLVYFFGGIILIGVGVMLAKFNFGGIN